GPANAVYRPVRHATVRYSRRDQDGGLKWRIQLIMSPATVSADQSCGGKPARIFWLGAHQLLVNTELARLRQLGYEVFNPPYLSHVLDQSALTSWNRGQPSTLPPDVFERLASYNFFYNTLDPEIADILNDYFDAVIVTIVARWVMEILRVFRGPILFR